MKSWLNGTMTMRSISFGPSFPVTKLPFTITLRTIPQARASETHEEEKEEEDSENALTVRSSLYIIQLRVVPAFGLQFVMAADFQDPRAFKYDD